MALQKKVAATQMDVGSQFVEKKGKNSWCCFRIEYRHPGLAHGQHASLHCAHSQL